MKLNFYLLLLIHILNIGCNGQAPLSGVIEKDKNEAWINTVYLIHPKSFSAIASSYVGAVIDSAEIKSDGTFAFQKMPDATESILLQIAIQKKGERFFNQLNNADMASSNYFPIVWKNGQIIKITAKASHFQQSLSIKNPSEENTAMLELRDIKYRAFAKYLSKLPDAHDEETLLIHEKALLNYQKELITFAETTHQFLPALVAIRWTSIEENYERIPEFLFEQCQKWQTVVPPSSFLTQLCEKGNKSNLPILIGDKIPNFPMPMIAGDTTGLHEMLGSKLTLIDLWASWCAPCRRENQEVLVPLWDKYHEKGFQIVGYGLEAGDKAWKKAIEKDGAGRWQHASHLSGDASPFFQALRIMTIPANYLVDNEGKILARNLHGEDLVKFVEQHLE